MKTKTSALLGLAMAIALRAYSQTTTTAPVNLDANDNARFLAGLPPSPGSPLAEIAKDPSWQEHAKYFDTAWAGLEQRQLSKIRAWDTAFIPDASSAKTPVFYMFSGPDYLYVDTFYPNASTYVLCGIEPVGPIPDVAKIKPGTLPVELHALQASLNSVLSFSFFITKDMKSDLQNHELNGTLPVIYIFMARSNKTIHEVTLVGLDSNGVVETMDDTNPGKKTLAPGIKITFSQPNATEPQTLYYFSTDISNDGLRKSGFLKFCKSLAPGNSFVKSASYLMHENYFSMIRSFLLDNSITLIEDDSGIPISYFSADKWQTRYFGSYPGPISLFAKYAQTDLFSIYLKSHPIPLDFGIGYRHYAKQSTLILSTRKPEPSPAATASVPAPSAAPVAVPAAPAVAPVPSVQ